jgi:phosphatidylserine decarboxylase
VIAKGTIHWIALPLVIGILAIVVSVQYASYIIYIVANVFFFLSVGLMIFFRDPPRSIGKGIVSPADGKILRVDDENRTVSIFMNIHNVHVNRAPIGGRVLSVERFPGSHSPAYSDESARNERVETTIISRLGKTKVTQTAGLLARRIVPWVRSGIDLLKGQRIGMIIFGSRVTVQMPDRVRILVKKGQKVRAGETSIGEVIHDLA